MHHRSHALRRAVRALRVILARWRGSDSCSLDLNLRAIVEKKSSNNGARVARFCGAKLYLQLMAHINDNYLKLKAGYLFPEISRRVKAFTDSNPAGAANLIRCGIGDVTEPLPQAAIEAMKSATDELGRAREFSRLRPRTGLRFSARSHRAGRISKSRHSRQRRRNFRERRLEM